MTRPPVLILGGGLAGLQARRLLEERGIETLLLEEREATGGLCRTVVRGAWSWDIGPHAFYSRHPEVMKEYHDLPVEYHRHHRRVRVCHRTSDGLLEVGYPFENGLADLPWRDRWECVRGYWRAYASGERPFRNLRHWIENGLGEGIARHFMIPYNEKIWSVPLDQISMALVKGKIEPEPPWKILRNALVPGTVGRGYQARFIYPRAGGAGAIVDAVRNSARGTVRTGARVAALRRDGDDWIVRDAAGATARGRAVISTIPIPSLLRALDEAALSRFEGRFRSNDTFLTAVGLKEGRGFKRFASCHWAFFAGEESFYRLTFMNALDPGRLPVVVAEATVKGGGAVPPEDSVIRDLLSAGILDSENDIGLVSSHREACTYPIQTIGMEEDREALESLLAARGIHLLGRSGRWDYVNTDGIFARTRAFIESAAGRLS